MNNFARHLTKMFGVTHHAIIEACAYGQNYVGVLHGHVRFIAAVHTGHTDIVRRRGAIAAQPHQRIHARHTDGIDQLIQLGRRIGQNHTAAGVNHRTFRMNQQIQ